VNSGAPEGLAVLDH